MKKWVYLFTEGNANMRELLGGKGANLAEMTNIGLPVPQGFTITTEACTQYYEDGREINEEIQGQINEYITKMEEITGKKFGDHENPLLVSVRSGARASMPGMMDTILNLGLNETVVNVIAEKSGNPRWAWDCYRRFIQMYSDVVMEVGKKYFEQLIDAMKEKKGVKQDVELTADDLKELAGQFKAEYKAKIGVDFPDDPKEQLMGAIKAVFRSWDNPRANVYRRDNDIPYSWGTAVNVQSMAFGNMGDDCGTGVAFTRDPATGAKGLFGEFLTNAQGEDVVAGVRTPMKIAEMADKFPEAFAQFQEVCKTLEDHYRDMQDMEFTVEHGKLYMLQTRNGKRTAQAALKIACDLVDEGMRTEEEAVAMIDPRNLDTLLHPQFDTAALKAATPIGKGLGASPGAACGKIVFTAEDAEEWHARGERVVLVRLETSPEDITGMKASQGILTVRGGMTSHAAVVARGMGTCCVSGCGDIAMDEENKQFTLAGKTFHEGDWLSIDGTTGNIYDGEIKTVDATIAGEFGRVMAWADKYRKLKVRTNADTPADAKKARELGAEGIGLCRTEHMFFEEDRIAAFREMICSDTVEEREAALEKILPYQQNDFKQLYEALEGNPVTIRFLDPPLHEFVPTEEAAKGKLSGYSAGFYATYMNDKPEATGPYADLWVLYQHFTDKVNPSNASEESYHSKGWTGSLEAGYTFGLKDWVSASGTQNATRLQLQAQVIRMGVRADEHVDAENFTVQGTGAGNVRTRIGATAYHLFTNPKTGRAIKPYLTLNWYHDTKNFGVVYDGVKDRIEGTRNFGEVKFGIEGKVSKNVNLWGAALYQAGSHSYWNAGAFVGAKILF